MRDLANCINLNFKNIIKIGVIVPILVPSLLTSGCDLILEKEKEKIKIFYSFILIQIHHSCPLSNN